MKSKSAYILTAVLLLPASALAWDRQAVDPAKQIPAATTEAPAAAPATGADAATTATAAKSEAAATGAAQNSLIGAPPAGKGQIVFFRPAKFVGGAIGYKVREGENVLGKLNSGKYFVAAVEPGAHEYTVHSEAKDILNLEVEAGETYYVQGTVTMGVFAGRPNLSPASQADFAAISAKLKPAK